MHHVSRSIFSMLVYPGVVAGALPVGVADMVAMVLLLVCVMGASAGYLEDLEARRSGERREQKAGKGKKDKDRKDKQKKQTVP